MKKLNAKQKDEIKKLKNDVILLSNFIDKFCTINTIGMTLNEYQDYILVKQILRDRAKILC